eukprot:gb/GEZN01011754.1/.p2 GENE.gb/GEZN01011754.1/~~gb/GEZN01011754.1/.p2  ORF type:complete len:203 (-),score=40.13 gb/GEZN01011754.1/:83-691(-)
MKTLHAERILKIPDGVTVEIKARVVTVTGPRGTLTRDFKHVAIQLKVIEQKLKAGSNKAVKAEMWFAKRKGLACLRTVMSHIENMMTGVTKGFNYKMRLVYRHFPINASIEKGGRELELRNFLGEKIIRTVYMGEGVTVERGSQVKDQLIIKGNDIEEVSVSAARIHHKAMVRNKDIRKFLDGVYVSEKGLDVDEDGNVNQS